MARLRLVAALLVLASLVGTAAGQSVPGYQPNSAMFSPWLNLYQHNTARVRTTITPTFNRSFTCVRPCKTSPTASSRCVNT